MKYGLKRFFFFILFIGAHQIQAQNWGWAVNGGGAGNDSYWAMKISKDKAHIYCAGPFEQTITIGTTVLTSVGSSDVVLSKYDTAGTLVWAERLGGGTGFDVASDMYEDDSSHLYISGVFNGKAVFGNDTLVAGGPGNCGFFAKYNSNGQQIWIKQTKGSGTCFCGDICVDKVGNIILAGAFTDSLTIGGISLFSKGSGDCFLAKLTPSGSVLWMQSAGGSGDDAIAGLNVDINNDIAITGWYANTAYFGSDTVTAIGPGANIFVAKYTTSGTNKWVRTAGGIASSYGSWLASDHKGNQYVVGYIGNSSVSFDTTSITCAGKTDIFIAKYDAMGNRKWVRRLGGPGFDESYYSVTDYDGNTFLTGRYTPYIPGNPIHNSEFLVAKYDSSGVMKWLKTATGLSSTFSESTELSYDQFNNLFIAGNYSSTCVFNGDSIGCSGGWDMCLVKLHDSTGIVNSIETYMQSYSLNVFPNPFSEYITMRIDGISNEELTIVFIDVLGREISSKKIKLETDGHTEVLLTYPEAPKGLYFIQIRAPGSYAKGVKILKD